MPDDESSKTVGSDWPEDTRRAASAEEWHATDATPDLPQRPPGTLEVRIAPRPLAFGGLRTLLFEEDVLKRRFLEQIFRARGYQVTPCSDPEDAWSTYQEDDYPLVVLGGRFGRALLLCQRLHTLPQRHLSLLLVVPWRHRWKDVRAALAVGADECLVRPLDIDLLNMRLANVERQVRALPEREDGDKSLVQVRSDLDYHIDVDPDELRAREHAFHRESALRREAEEALERARAEFERRVSQYLTQLDALTEALRVETASRKELDASLRDARTELDRRVQAHTAELRALGDALQAQSGGRQDVESALRQARAELDRLGNAHGTETRRITDELRREAVARADVELALRHARADAERAATLHADETERLSAALQRTTDDLDAERTGRRQAEEALLDARRGLGEQSGTQPGELHTLAASLEQEAAGHRHANEALQAVRSEHAAVRDALKEEGRRRERAEVALTHAEEEARRSLADLRANARRELRVSMNAIIGMADTALEALLTGPQRECVRLMRASAEAASAGLDVLTGSTGRGPEPVAVSIKDDLRELLNVLALRARQKGIELISHIAPQVPPTVIGHPEALRQVIANVVGNAINSTEQGEVSLRIDATGSAGDGSTVLMFAVVDSGTGVATDRQDELFDTLASSEERLTQSSPTGPLGLAVSSHLVRRMAGRIWFESEPEQGSIFHFTARVGVPHAADARPARPVPRQSVASRPAGSPPRILVADDTPDDRALVTRILEERGHQVVAVQDGAEALSALAEGPFDLLLTDLRMPRIDGFELAAAIRTRDDGSATAGAELPIVGLSVPGITGDPGRCRAVGIHRTVAKPVAAAELFATVEPLLTAHR
jgi:signal transduction histidine kinase